MGVLDALIGAAGSWKGTYRLWETSRPPQQSKSTASVTPVIGNRFVRIDYAWSYDGAPQEGSLLCGHDAKRRVIVAVWIDSWHMSDKMLTCEGPARKTGPIVVNGSYSVTSGPDWGWRTVLEAGTAGSFRMVMYNISPEGRKDLAVETTFARPHVAGRRRR